MQNAWRLAIQSLSSEVFLDVVRTYVGPVKTPYRKHELLEELENFMRRPETIEHVVGLIGPADQALISLALIMPGITRDEVVLFFGGDEARTMDLIVNLEERLILFETPSDRKKAPALAINPFWEESLRQSVFNPGGLFSPEPTAGEGLPPEWWAEATRISVAPLALAALVAFFSSDEHPVKVMADGHCRCAAKTLKAFSDSFPPAWSAESALEFMLKSRLLTRTAERVSVNVEALLQGKGDNPGISLACMCAGFPGAENFLQAVLAILPEDESFSFESFRRHALYAAFFANNPSFPFESSLASRLLGALAQTGLVQSLDGGASFRKTRIEPRQGSLLRVGGDGHILVQPDADFSAFFPLVPCLDLIELGTVAEFAISRSSAARGFRQALDSETLIAKLEAASGAPLPQNLVYSLSAWEREHKAVTIAEGVVVCGDNRLSQFMENAAELREAVVERLAPGVYLTAFPSMEAAESALRRSGYETPPRLFSAGKARKKTPAAAPSLFFSVHGAWEEPEKRQPPIPAINRERKQLANEQGIRERQGSLLSSLEGLKFPRETAEALAERIRLKLVISPSGLRSDTLRLERGEAGGLDYIGKVKLLEKARQEPGWLLDLLYRDGQGNPVRVLARLSALKKTQSGLWVECQIHGGIQGGNENNVETLRIPVERISHVKRIRMSIFR
jgi:hypothetical protein